MIESRCGVECSKNNCKEKYGVDCPGCVNLIEPFWGVCRVKKCCEEKMLENCGYCSEFPCELLNSFAYDKENGEGDGSRLKQCERWCCR
jgi:hypothetical protein